MFRKKAPRKEMGWVEYLETLQELGRTQSWAGRTLAKSDVTGRRWVISSRIPDSAAIVLRLMRAGVITEAQVLAAKDGPLPPRARPVPARCESEIS